MGIRNQVMDEQKRLLAKDKFFKGELEGIPAPRSVSTKLKVTFGRGIKHKILGNYALP